MSAGWVAGSVRARAMTRRRIGVAAVHDLAQCPSLDEAVAALARTSYGHEVSVGQDLASAQASVVASAVWNLRVLAGWQPQRGVTTIRLLSGLVEAVNVIAHLEGLLGAEPRPTYRLGALGTAWSRIATTTTPDQVRQVLATSGWGDPGGSSLREVALGMRTGLADRIVGAVPDAAAWAAGDAALLLAREAILKGRPLPDRARLVTGRMLGPAALGARTLSQLRESLPPLARWALDGVEEPHDLWRAEGRWWRRLADDGAALVRSSRPGEPVLVGAVALLAADAWQVRAALEVAARGGSEIGVLDEVG
ncbi:hypothetical protein [Nocardioides sp.]|uniref:hypothetical protein n=1 Tax=Nocardioides sp. TaxID=35761 RepID=UPI00356993C1